MALVKRLLPRLPVILLSLVLLLVFFQNYASSTFLTGWDNLMPELNLGLNLKRSLLAVWQEYQGLGLNGGMGHATDLIRQLLLLPFTIILPTSIIRYLWHFSMITLGTFSLYFGLKKVLRFSSWIVLPSALFYLLNFGSVQNFWAPLESFSTFWGFFPLLIFSLISYLQKPTRRHLLILTIINFLAIPSFYVQTIFLVYLLCVFIILFSHFLSTTGHRRLAIRHEVKVLILVLILNAFWLLPFFYFLRTNAQNPELSIGNLIATPETVERNLYRGHLSDFLLLRGYYYDFIDNGSQFMAPWHTHFAVPGVLLAGYLLGLVAIFGLIILLVRFRPPRFFAFSFLGLFLLVAVALLSATPPFAQVNSLIRTIPLIDQAFRSPFTKFITPAAFIFAVLTAYGLEFLSRRLSKFSFLIPSAYFPLLLFFSFPVFTGNYIYRQMRQTIPADYFQLINFFKAQSPTARIADLPQGDYWGWTSYRWGVRGSGFLWYGIEQPILDRAFDAWNLNNENYYWELSYILQKGDPDLFTALLRKYSIQFIYYDDSVYFPGQLVFDKIAQNTKDLLSHSPELKAVAHFGAITVYQTPFTTAPYLTADTAFSPSLLPSVNTYRSPSAVPVLGLSVIPISSPNFTPITFKDGYGYHLYGYSFPNAKLNQNYYLHLSYQHLSGHPLIIGLYDDTNHFRYTTTLLDSNSATHDLWFFIPAMESGDFDNGLSVVFNNASFTGALTQNRVSRLELYATPWPAAAATPSTPTGQTLSFRSQIAWYQVTLPPSTTLSTLVLPQSYDPGWLAVYFTGLRPHFLSGHTPGAGWANAWNLPSALPATVYFFFWPQTLEFLGLALLPLAYFRIRKVSHNI